MVASSSRANGTSSGGISISRTVRMFSMGILFTPIAAPQPHMGCRPFRGMPVYEGRISCSACGREL